MTLNLGFIGCGAAARAHADVVVALGHTVTAACARGNSGNLKEFSEKYKVGRTYTDWRKMIAGERPDAYVLAVSWDQTELMAEDVMKTGVPCLVEKPVALSSAKLAGIISGAGAFALNAQVAYNRRFYDFVPYLKKAVDAGGLVSIELNMPELAEELVRKYSPAIADYILVYMSSHWLDLLTYLAGELRVEYMHRGRSSGPAHQSYNGILYTARHGAPIHLQANFNAPSRTSIAFNFADIIYRLCPAEELTVYRGIDCIEAKDGSRVRRYVPRVLETFQTDTAFKPGFYKQMVNFIETCVLKNRANETGCTLNEALAITMLCEDIRGQG